MAKFKNDNLDLLTGQYVDFDDANLVHMGYDNGELYVNTTLSGLRAVLPYHLLRYDQHEFIEQWDTPATYSGSSGKTATVNETEDGLIFTYAQPGATATGTTPPDPGDTNLWYNNEDHILYYWDNERESWLSIMSHYYLWTYNGGATGAYMAIGNITHDSAFYYIPKTATITSISSSAQKTQESSKTFQVETAASGTVLEFSHTNWLYRDDTVNVHITEEDEMKCYITSDGQAVRNAIVTLEIKWRYEE